MFIPQHFWEAVHIQDISNCVPKAKELLSVLANEMVSWLSARNDCLPAHQRDGFSLLSHGEWLRTLVDHHNPLPTLTTSRKRHLRTLAQPKL